MDTLIINVGGFIFRKSIEGAYTVTSAIAYRIIFGKEEDTNIMINRKLDILLEQNNALQKELDIILNNVDVSWKEKVIITDNHFNNK